MSPPDSTGPFVPSVPSMEPPENAPALSLLAFYVGSQEYVVDLARVSEIAVPGPVHALPNAPPWVEGVMELKGAVVPLLDTRMRLGTQSTAPKYRPAVLVCWLGRRRVGIRADAVSQVVRARRADLQPAPTLAMPGAASFVFGVCSTGGKTRLLLDVKELWRAPRPLKSPRRSVAK